MQHLWTPWRMKYIQEKIDEKECVFCQAHTACEDESNFIVHRGENVFVMLNLYPYTTGHLLILPYLHESTLEALNRETQVEIMELVTKSLEILRSEYQPGGFNVGVNLGEAAGAGIPEHVHWHVVPRWPSDTNFLSSVGETRIIPEDLTSTYDRVFKAWERSND